MATIDSKLQNTFAALIEKLVRPLDQAKPSNSVLPQNLALPAAGRINAKIEPFLTDRPLAL
ncbi:hypothetical protein IVG45_17900 [Methylomonas sp. LL1]|uniref:hypothetical protein n=1 Tax=Methylomonas sp. LL1 TaxID=2785785 RepID=UPI0018C3A229|nr:hypothetical protein [Methylomonas sp. LL1]QPK62693.1 hypothetical protein IVG45_17900 [Methylomonas sp. LL1]